jgi:formyl-CoA transferase
MSALEGIRVLDMTHVQSGPSATQILAWLGADVVKLEAPTGDITRKQLRDLPDVDSLYFTMLNCNKRSITLNMKSEEGKQLFIEMVQKADVLVENYRPDVKQRLGIGYETMAAINPRLIYASISGYGEDGPYRMRPGFDQIAQGMGGLMSITGLPGQGPVRVGIPIADLCAGIFCAYGIAVALIEREKSGKGQWVKSSLLQAQLFMLDFQAARWLMRGEVPKQAGNNHPTSIPTGVYKTRDGYMNLAVTGTKIWNRMCQAIGAADLANHPDYASSALRSKNRDKLHDELEEFFKKRDTAEWIRVLNEAGVPSGPIYSIDQAFADPQVQHLGMVQKVGDVPYLGQPVTLSRTPSRMVSHPPAQGAHTAEVLRELGYEEEKIAELRKKGIV